MDPRRPRVWEWAAGATGLVLLASLFMGWTRRDGEQLSGWGSFAVTDVLLALAALMGIAVLAAALTQRVGAVPIAVTSLTALAASLAALVALVRLAFPPGDGAVERLAGTWIGTAAVVLLAAWAWIAMRDERPAGSAAAAPPTVPPRRLPAPPAQASGGQGGAAEARPAGS